MEVCNQSTMIPLGCCFLLLHFPSSKMSSSNGIQFPEEKNPTTCLLSGLSMGCCFYRTHPAALTQDPPEATMGCRGIFALVPGVPPPILL